MMTSLAWFCAIFGFLVAAACASAILVDVYWVEHGVPTISRRTLEAATAQPALAALISGIACLFLGMLLGHLFFGQKVG